MSARWVCSYNVFVISIRHTKQAESQEMSWHLKCMNAVLCITSEVSNSFRCTYITFAVIISIDNLGLKWSFFDNLDLSYFKFSRYPITLISAYLKLPLCLVFHALIFQFNGVIFHATFINIHVKKGLLNFNN